MTVGMSFGLARRRKPLLRRFPWATRRSIPTGRIVGMDQCVSGLVSKTWVAGSAIPLPRLAVKVSAAFAPGQNAVFISLSDAVRFDHSVLRDTENANALPSVASLFCIACLPGNPAV
jgi:hypothetical protein